MSEVIYECVANGCQCEPCQTTGPHWSDCAFHGQDTESGITYDGPCTCAVVGNKASNKAPERTCTLCGKYARYKVTWLLPNARRNPASSGYGRDDISHCADKTTARCEDHKNERKFPVRGFEWCATQDMEWAKADGKEDE